MDDRMLMAPQSTFKIVMTAVAVLVLGIPIGLVLLTVAMPLCLLVLPIAPVWALVAST